MSLHIIGLGLCDEKDISMKGLKAIRECDLVYLESYTSMLSVSREDLEAFYQKRIKVADRKLVENSDEILHNAMSSDVAFLVPGDPFAATTHFDLFMRARKKNIKTEVIGNTSVFTAVARTGLSLYKFGATTSIPIPDKNYKPTSFVEVIDKNLKNGLHTLILPEVRPADASGMTVKVALDSIVASSKKIIKGISESSNVIVCARLGAEDEKIKFGSIKVLSKEEFGKPPYCIVVPGILHFAEEEALNLWK